MFDSEKNPGIWALAASEPAWMWWGHFLADYPELAYVGMRANAASNSTKHSERSWGYLEYIHNKRRNRLTTERADDLVYCYHNLRVLRRHKECGAHDDDAIPWSCVVAEEAGYELEMDGEGTDEMDD